MTKTNILNLDELETKKQKVIKLHGKEHVFQPFTVENYIENIKSMEVLNAKQMRVEKAIKEKREPNPDDLVSQDELFNITVNNIIRAFPTLSKEQVLKMPIEMLNTIADYISEENSSVEEEAQEAVDTEKK